MKLTKKLEAEIKKFMKTYWDTYLKGDLKTWATFLPADYKNIGGTEEELWNSKKEILDYTKRVTNQMTGQMEIRNTKYQIFPYDPYIMVHEFTDIFIKVDKKWTFYGKFRLSSIIQKTEGGWKVLHQHGSFPDSKTAEGEAFSVDTLKSENLKLQKAVKDRTAELQEKNRELEIDAALERIRARSMAMHSSEELNDVLSVLFQQVELLGIDAKCAHLTLMDVENNRFSFRLTGRNGAKNIGEQIIDLDAMDAWKETVEKWKNSKPHIHQCLVYPPEVLPALWKLINKSLQSLPAKERIRIKDYPKGLFDCEGHTKFGYIGFNNSRPPTEEEINIVVKFANEFERVYQRFLDIQKAEAQTREAQIEAALERIRAKSMAMQQPDDLNDVLSLLFQQFDILDIKPVNVWLSLLDLEKETFTYRATGTGGSRLHTNQVIDFYAMDIWQEALKQWKTDTPDSVLLTHYPNDIWPQLIEVFSETFMSMPEDERLKPEDFPNGLFNVQGYTKFGYLGFNHFREPTDEEKDILRKFAKEFERVYQRFLDIQKAEAQAREGQIEAALEKVRSRSLGMQKSDELQEVVRVVAEKITELGVVLEIGGVVICTYPNEGEKDQIHWTASFDPLLPSVPYYLPYFDTPLSVEAWAAKLNGDEYFEKVLTKEENLHFFNLALVHSDYKNLPDAYKTALLACEHHGFSFAIQKNSALMVASIEGKLLNEAHKSILIRFSRVFEQAYIRFMDLQKAEAQAREAQIEAALEKVRSRSLAMHNADELQEVVTVVGEKLQELGVILDSGGVVICTYFPDSKDVMHWTATFDSSFPSVPYFLPYFDTPIFIETWDSKNSGADFFEKNYSFEDKNHFFHYAFEHSDYKNLPAEYKQALLDAESHALSFAWAKNSALMIASHTGMLLPEEHKIILKRFAKVFEQAYIRFMDLQKAEAQAKEAQIEAALEKVRSRSMAMHNSKELQQVVNVVYDQLKELGLQIHAAVVTGTIKPKSAYEVWVGGSTFSEPLVIPYTDSTQVQRDYNREIENRPELFCKTYSGEIMKEYFDFLMQENEFPDDLEKLMLECKAFSTTLTFAKNSGMQLVRYSDEPYTNAENKILIRFNNVFEQTYVRFLDLQKAEAQAREAQIETALEKVRARSMAMQSSTELHEILGILFSQFDNLGIKPVNVFLSLFNRENRTLTYRASGKSGTRIPGMQVIKVDSMEALKALFDKWLTDNSDSVEVIHYPKEVLPQLFGIFAETFAAMPEEDRMGPEDFPDGGYSMAGYTPFGYLGYDHQRQATEEEKDILSRFCVEFTRVYQRFLDIQKAEAQAREAQIEMALERVRSRTMAMHQSQELKEVIYTTFEQMKSLDITINFCAIDIHGENIEDLNLWVAAPDQNYAQLQVVPFFDHPLLIQTAAAKKRNDTDFVIHLSGEENKKFYEHIFEHTSFKESMSDERKHMILQTKGQDLIGSCFSQSALFISNFQGYVYTDKERNTLLRFAKVFEQAYTRFLDLQKAETQAREAQIEMALERVRARSMGMHQTDELSDVLCVLFEQFDFLGINPVLTHLTLMDEANETFTLRITTSPKERVFAEQKIDIHAVESWRASFENWKKAKPNTVDCIDYAPEVLPYVWEVMHEVMTALPEGHKINPKDFPDGLFTTQGHFKFGYLGFNHKRRATEEEKNIVSRFATEFGRVYQRFLDIQKAEAQAKESEIQLALERVRARTMAMHNSNELGEVASVLFEQISLLTNTPDRFNIGIANEEDSTFDVWVTDQQGHKISKLFVAAADKSPVIFEVFEAWKRKEDFIVQDLYGEQLEGWLQYMGKELGIPFDKNQVKVHRYINSIFFTHGFIGITTNDLPNPETLKLIERFAKVFQQTYTRFLDLQKAEAQTRESQIEASLERIRAKAMAMQHTEELNEVIGLLCEQYDILGINPVCAHLALIDVENNRFSLRLTGKKGARNVGEQIIDANAMPVWAEAVEKWRNSEPLSHQCLVYPLEQVPTVLSILDGVISTMPEEARISTADFPDGLFSCEGQNKFGNLGFNHSRPPTEEEIEIVKRFAREFERIYQRFLDLEKAEAQVREAQVEAGLERVRSRTMAMQNSDELAETSVVVFKQLIDLGIEPNRLYIGIITDNSGDIEFWATDEDGSKISSKFTGNKNNNTSLLKMYDAWLAKEKSLTIDMQGKELEEYFNYLGNELHVPFKEGLLQKRRVQTMSFFSKGFIGIASPEEQPEATTKLLERFAAVFNLTFTRFNDLKIAEANALQAEKDLIEIKAAKQSAETALTELKSTQSQLVQSEKMASLGELTAGIAHEIQNPLNFVNNFSEVSKELLEEMNDELEKGNLEDVRDIMKDVIQNLEKINHHGKRADGIVKGMLQHSRSSSGTKEPTDINALADEYLRLAYHGLRAKDKSFNATMKTDYDESLQKVNVIPQDIGRVILNLITNAFYAVTEKKKEVGNNYEPTVTVTTSSIQPPLGGRSVVIKVSDNGGGIPPKVLDKIFQPFFTTKPTGQGTGLGLSLAFDIVTKGHGGELKVETKESEGTIFIIQLPTT